MIALVVALILTMLPPPFAQGYATWYQANGRIGAAGPALRGFLGPQWRGSVLRVCHGRCVTVTLTDWCACPDTLLDLSDDAFRALAPLGKGRITVTVVAAAPLPATDTAP